MSEDDLSKSRTSVPVLRYAAADIVKQHTTELARSASVSSGVSSSKINTPAREEEELKIEDQPADSPRSESSSASEKDVGKENIFENKGGMVLTQSTPIPIATAQDIVRLSDSLSNSAPESFNDSSPVSLSTLSTRQRSHSTGTAISQDELERRVLFDAFSANKAGAEKLHKFFGMPIAFESFVSVAPQPRHVKEYKMKKIFGEEIAIEHRAGIKKSMDDEDIRYMNQSQKHRRVGKFFGESLDVSQPSSLQEPFGLSRRVSRMLQPEHVDVGKLNKFFGRPTYIQKEKDDEQEGEDDSSAMERQQIQQQIKKSRKLRNYFGEAQPVLDPNAKQFAPQPAHVKGYKLSKHFGCHVVIEHGTESKSNTNSPPESMVDSSNSNTMVTVEQTQPQNIGNEEPVVKRELLLLLPDRTLDPSPRIVSASDSGTRSARKASKILGEPLTPNKKELANSHREPLYKEGNKKSHREKDKDKEKEKERDEELKEPKEHKEKEHKKKKEDKN
jgi:hypothetical protein